jgi:hypothetical protein
MTGARASQGPASHGLVFQCAACRALVVASSVVIDKERERAALPCHACGAACWLPWAGAPGGNRTSTEVVDVEPAHPGAPAARALPSGALVPSSPAAVEVAAGGDADLRSRILERLPELGPVAEGQRDLAAAFDKLLLHWHSEAEHKAFMQRAAMQNELAFAGQRYRLALDVAPADPHAKRAQGEILTLAMVSLNREKDLGSTDADKTRAKLALAFAAALIIAVVSLWWMVKVLRGPPQDAMIEAPPP